VIVMCLYIRILMNLWVLMYRRFNYVFRCSGIVDLFCSRSFVRFFVEGTVMSSLSRELVFLILQFLDEEKFKETVHKYASLRKFTRFSVFNLNCQFIFYIYVNL